MEKGEGGTSAPRWNRRGTHSPRPPANPSEQGGSARMKPAPIASRQGASQGGGKRSNTSAGQLLRSTTVSSSALLCRQFWRSCQEELLSCQAARPADTVYPIPGVNSRQRLEDLGIPCPSMTQKNGTTTGGMAGAASVLALLAVVSGVYAINQPMSLRIEQLGDLVEEMRADMKLDDVREREDARAFATLAERFREITALDEQIHAEFSRRLQLLEGGGNQRHDEKIRALEKALEALKKHLPSPGPGDS